MPEFPTEDWFAHASRAVADDEAFQRTSRAFDATLRFDFGEVAYAMTIEDGTVEQVHHDPGFVSWDVALRGTAATWRKLLQPTPPPRYNDPLGAWLRGDLTIEGNLKLAIQHLRPLKRMFVVFREVGT